MDIPIFFTNILKQHFETNFLRNYHSEQVSEEIASNIEEDGTKRGTRIKIIEGGRKKEKKKDHSSESGIIFQFDQKNIGAMFGWAAASASARY